MKRLLPLLLLLLLFLLWKLFKEEEKEELPHIPPPSPSPFLAKLYFCKDDALFAEERPIKRGKSLLEQIELVLEALCKGPQKEGLLLPLPPSTEVLAVYVVDDAAVVDLSLHAHRGEGSFYETLSIYSLVNTITANFPQIKRVKLLVEGEERLTLCGHIDIRFPLLPREDLVKDAIL